LLALRAQRQRGSVYAAAIDHEMQENRRPEPARGPTLVAPHIKRKAHSVSNGRHFLRSKSGYPIIDRRQWDGVYFVAVDDARSWHPVLRPEWHLYRNAPNCAGDQR
jgi:hypothetical protein